MSFTRTGCFLPTARSAGEPGGQRVVRQMSDKGRRVPAGRPVSIARWRGSSRGARCMPGWRGVVLSRGGPLVRLSPSWPPKRASTSFSPEDGGAVACQRPPDGIGSRSLLVGLRSTGGRYCHWCAAKRRGAETQQPPHGDQRAPCPATYLCTPAERAGCTAFVAEETRDRAWRQVAQRRAVPLLQHRSVLVQQRRSHDIRWRRRRAAIQVGMEPYASVRQDRSVRQGQIVPGRTHRSAVERSDDGAAIVAMLRR